MIKILKKETLYFLVILVVLALIKHPDLLSSPLIRLDLMLNAKDSIHPFLWSFVVYFVILLLRLVLKGLLGLKDKFKGNK